MKFLEPKEAIKQNSFILIIIGFTGYFLKSSPTALIPVVFGLLTGVCYMLYDKNTKLVAHISLLLLILILISLFMPLMSRLNASDVSGFIRILTMQITTAYCVLCFVKSFIEARKK